MPKRIGAVFAVVVALALPASVYAEGAKYTLSLTKDYTASPWTSEVGYTNRLVGKVGFGVKNLLLGWTELFTEPKEAMDEGGNFFVGLGKGLLNGVLDTVGGAVHLVTFPITALDAPLPEGGTQLFQ
jgi:hypothetical protein